MSELQPTTQELVDRVRDGGLMDDGRLKRPIYDLITDIMPLLCVDVLPVQDGPSGPRLGIITRATGPERHKPAILGGRINKDETISRAVGRHLLGSLGSAEFTYHQGNDEGRPFYIAQYVHTPSAPGGYDPTKHAIALNYLIRIPEPKRVKDEALDFKWTELDEIPEVSAYNHHLAMQRAADFLHSLGRVGLSG